VSDVEQQDYPEKDELALRLKTLRERLGFTLSQASEATKQIDTRSEGVSKVSISRYENGGSFPGYRELRLLAQTYGVSVSFLFYGDRPDPFAGWEFSLDQFLSDLIDDRLIEHGLIEGESRYDREMRKMMAQSLINRRRQRLPEPEPDEPKPPGLDSPETIAMAEAADAGLDDVDYEERERERLQSRARTKTRKISKKS